MIIFQCCLCVLSQFKKIHFSEQIVITGIGAITPVGIGGHETYEALCAGKSGIRKLPSWADEFPAQVSQKNAHKWHELTN